MPKAKLTLAGFEALEIILAKGGLWVGDLSNGKRRAGRVHPKTVDYLVDLGLAEIVESAGGIRGLDWPAPGNRVKGERFTKHCSRVGAHRRAMEKSTATYVHPTAQGVRLLNEARALLAGKG